MSYVDLTPLAINPNSKGYSPTLPKDMKKPEKNPFVCFMKKIWNAVKWVFSKIGDFFKRLFHKDEPKLKLSNREIEMIQNADHYKKKPPQQKPAMSPSLSPRKINYADALLDPEYLTPSKLKKVQSDDLLLYKMDIAKSKTELDKKQEVVAAEKKKKEELPPIKDPIMKEFHDTAQEFVEGALDCVFEKKIGPAVSNVKHGLGQLSEGLKFGADLAIKVGDKAAKPLFEKLSTFSIEEKLKPDFQSFLNWMLKNGVRKTFEAQLQKALKKEFNDSTELKTFTEPCIKWLLETNHSDPLSMAYEQAGIQIEGNREKIDKVFEAAMLVLLDHKIGKYMDKCHDKLEGRLPEIMHDMLVDNGKRITSILTRRLIDVIENSQHSKMFDTLVGVALDQTEGIIAVEKAKEAEVKRQKALIEKAKQAKDTNPKNSEEAKTKFNLLMHLRTVEKIGEEKWIQMKAEEKGLEAYSKLKLCHPQIAKLMNNPNLDTKEKEKIEEELFDSLAEEIIPILLPKQKVQLPDGTIKEVDGLVHLCSQVEVPIEFKELAAEAVEISKEILTPETQQVIKGIYENIWEIAGEKIQEIIVSQVKATLKHGIKVGARTLFDKFITPNLINDLVGSNMLPAIQEQMLITLAMHDISQNQPKYATYFHELISINDDEKETREKALGVICKELHTLVGKATSQYKKEFQEMDYEEFKTLILPVVESMESGIRSYQESKGTTSKESVKVALGGYFKEVYAGSNPLFGDLAVNLVFKLGKFDNTAEFFSDWIKGMISEQITSATHKIQKSPHFLVQTATEQIKKNYLEKEAIEELLFGEKKELPEEDVNAHLQEEIAKTAKVAHDLIMKKVSDTSGAWIKKPIVKGVVGTNHKKLSNLISRVYGKVFGNQLMTHNLIVRGQEVVMETLANASKKVDYQNNLVAKKVDKVPTIIPDLFAA